MPEVTWNAAWDGRPAEYAAKRDCWLTRRRIRYVGDFLRVARPGDAVLELGSGVGDLLGALASDRPDLRFTGIEPQVSYVEYSEDAARRAGVRNLVFRTAAAEDLRDAFSPAERFDWILSNDVLHHVADAARVLNAAAAVSRETTRWLAIEPNARNPYSFLSALARRGERNFWPGRFLRLARAAGWSRRQVGFLFLVPPFVREPPDVLAALERRLEAVPWLAGGIALTLERS